MNERTAGAAAPTQTWPAAAGRTTDALRRASRSVLTRLALGAPVRVFVLEGVDAPGALELLRLRPDVMLVETPRSATVLLVAGRLPEPMHEPAQRAHDAMAEPRATVWWTVESHEGMMPPFPDASLVSAEAHDSLSDAVASLAAILAQTQSELLRAVRSSEPALLPDVDPAPWRAVGPYGQGGAGMTGGLPYGRPMAERAPDRDGLELDQLPVRVGPFFAPFPRGLVLDVTLQGDVIQQAVVPGNADVSPDDGADAVRAAHDPFIAALREPARIADLERVRARHHLRWLAGMLRVHGLDALALRTLTLATTLADSVPRRAAADLAGLGRLLERTRALGWATARVGVIEARLLAHRGLGPVARAAGLVEDARIDDPAYHALEFKPVVQSNDGGRARHAVGDAHARWRQRLSEAVQSLELASRAGDRVTGGDGRPIESLRGRVSPDTAREPPTTMLLALLPDLLRGQEWGDAVTTIVSLDLDMREAALAADTRPLASPPTPKASDGMSGMSGMNAKSDGMGDGAHQGHAPAGM